MQKNTVHPQYEKDIGYDSQYKKELKYLDH